MKGFRPSYRPGSLSAVVGRSQVTVGKLPLATRWYATRVGSHRASKAEDQVFSVNSPKEVSRRGRYASLS